ncbi:diguanylate cyclase/phosphodiesterase (GGDEF & EAL domains) with PAS/PAC sensor(s) [hydrothermal vent metagenome]|uniref:histidine kinase n=1 Tax=hydrothermal vent metagenome TaxID=652676 RepID=A0A3B0Z8P1_9ZZZZ
MFCMMPALLYAAPPNTTQSVNETNDSSAPLIISIDSHYYPFTFVDEHGEAAGLFVDVWHLWAEKTGQKITFRPSTWDETLKALRSGDADIHSGLFKSETRAHWIDFSSPFYGIGSALFYASGASPYRGLADLRDQSVGAVKGAFQAEYLRQQGVSNVVLFDSLREMISALRGGGIEAFLSEVPTVQVLLDRLGRAGGIESSDEILLEKRIYAGVVKGNTALLEVVNSGLAAISSDEFSTLERRWIAYPGFRYFKPEAPSLLHSLSEEERLWLAKNPVIRMGGEFDWPPFDFVENGVYQGLTADYLALLSERLGVKFEMVVDNPWAVTLAMLEERQVDAIAAIWETPERKSFALFTPAYEELSIVVFTRTENMGIKGIDDLRSATVAVVRGYATQDSLATDYPDINQLEVDNTLAGLEAVSQGRADAYIGTLAVAAYLLEKHFISNIKVAGKTPLEEVGISMGVRSDWPILASILEKGLNSITTTEKIEIRRRWISLPPSKSSPKIELTPSESAWLAEHPVVRIGGDSNWPPMEFLSKDGVYQGLSADYLALLSQRLGIEFEVVTYSDWPATLEMLKNKQLDTLGGVVRTDEREQYALFTQPYNELSAVIFTRQQHPVVKGISDLTHSTIAIERGYSNYEVLRRDYPDIALLVVDTSLQALEAVSQGRADAYIGTLAVGSHLLEKHFITNLRVAANTPFEMEALSIGVRNDWPELLSILNKGLDSITVAERIDIRRRWILADLPQPKSGGKVIDLTPQERAWLREHPVVRFTGDPNWLPFEAFTEQGEFIGIISGLLNNLEQRTGVKFERLPSGTWLNALSMAKNGEIDVLSDDVGAESMVHTHTFTQPYLERPLAIVMRSEQTEVIPDLNDIADKRIGVIDGYGYVGKLSKRYPDINFIKVKNIQDGLIGLSSGHVDAFVATFTLSSYHINQMGMSTLRIVGGLPVVLNMGLAVRNDWPELLSILNKAIDLITPAEKHEIVNQWMQEKYIKRIDYGLLKQVVLMAAVALLLMLLWNYSVQRQKTRLRLSEERFQLAMAAASDGIWDWNIVTGEAYYSPAYMNMLGYSPGELPEHNDTWQRLLHPDDKSSALAVAEAAIRSNASRYEHEFRLQAKDGSYRDILSKGSVVSRDKQGNALRAVGTQADITERKQAQESLRKLSLAVEQSPSMVMITDRYGVIEYVNPKFTDVTGFTSEEALGQTPALLKSDLTSSATYQDMWQTITAGRDWYGDLQNRKKNGEIYWERETISPLLGDDGVIKHYVALKEDITKRKAVEEDLQVFRRFAETSGQGFGITTLGGEITYVNQTLCQMMKETSVDAVCGRDFSHYYSAEINAYFKQEIMPLLKGNSQWTGELPFLTATGESIPTLENLFVIRDEQGKARFFGNVITDITQQKNTEKVLQEAKDQAEQANKSKGEFLANMSHEIRSPLNAVTGMTYLLQKTPLTTRQQDYLNIILSSSNTLLGVINDILDFSKIEAGHLKMEQTRFLLDDVFKNLSSLESLRASQKELEIVFSIDKGIPQAVVGDPLRLGQILINLTSNAIKFTERGQIVVSVVPVSLQGERVKLNFSVQDTGIGIEQTKAAQLFEPFTQADGSTTRQYGGTGLGLAICKQLVELMDGSIGVESEIGRGSRFYFDVEFTRADDEGEMPLLPSPDLSGMRVLVVDDNAVARETLQAMLESFSFNVSVVSSGSEALAELERACGAGSDGHYDLVLMDWKMPGMDGVEASRLIQQSDWLPQLPTVIMVTAYSRDEVMKEANKVGIEGFLVKPVNASTLFNAIVEALAPSNGGDTLSVPIPVPEINLSGARVLVVEDNRINQRIAREILQGVGVEVEVAANGAIAVQAVRDSSFDLVLMDLQMPEMDGYQATRMIRKDKQFDALPIIAMTAHAMAGDREKCLDAGMNDHLTKPIDPEHLFAVLQRWIEIVDPINESNVTADCSDAHCGGLPLGNLVGIDLSKGLARIGGNQTLFLSLLQEFVDDHQADSMILDDALNAGDMASARRLIHTLRSVAGSIGAEALEESAVTLEQALASDKLYPEAHAAFLIEFNQVMNSLVDALDNVTVAEPEAEKNVEWVDVDWEGIQTLGMLLFEGNASAKSCFQQCKSGLAQFAEAEELLLLEGQVADYDFTEAHNTLRRIVAKSDRPTYLQGSS